MHRSKRSPLTQIVALTRAREAGGGNNTAGDDLLDPLDLLGPALRLLAAVAIFRTGLLARGALVQSPPRR